MVSYEFSGVGSFGVRPCARYRIEYEDDDEDERELGHGRGRGIRCYPLSRARIVPGDSRRPEPNHSKVQNARVPHLPTGEKTATPESRSPDKPRRDRG